MENENQNQNFNPTAGQADSGSASTKKVSGAEMLLPHIEASGNVKALPSLEPGNLEVLSKPDTPDSWIMERARTETERIRQAKNSDHLDLFANVVGNCVDKVIDDITNYIHRGYSRKVNRGTDQLEIQGYVTVGDSSNAQNLVTGGFDSVSVIQVSSPRPDPAGAGLQVLGSDNAYGDGIGIKPGYHGGGKEMVVGELVNELRAYTEQSVGLKSLTPTLRTSQISGRSLLSLAAEAITAAQGGGTAETSVLLRMLLITQHAHADFNHNYVGVGKASAGWGNHYFTNIANVNPVYPANAGHAYENFSNGTNGINAALISLADFVSIIRGTDPATIGALTAGTWNLNLWEQHTPTGVAVIPLNSEILSYGPDAVAVWVISHMCFPFFHNTEILTNAFFDHANNDLATGFVSFAGGVLATRATHATGGTRVYGPMGAALLVWTDDTPPDQITIGKSVANVQQIGLRAANVVLYNCFRDVDVDAAFRAIDIWNEVYGNDDCYRSAVMLAASQWRRTTQSLYQFDDNNTQANTNNLLASPWIGTPGRNIPANTHTHTTLGNMGTTANGRLEWDYLMKGYMDAFGMPHNSTGMAQNLQPVAQFNARQYSHYTVSMMSPIMRMAFATKLLTYGGVQKFFRTKDLENFNMMMHDLFEGIVVLSDRVYQRSGFSIRDFYDTRRSNTLLTSTRKVLFDLLGMVRANPLDVAPITTTDGFSAGLHSTDLIMEGRWAPIARKSLLALEYMGYNDLETNNGAFGLIKAKRKTTSGTMNGNSAIFELDIREYTELEMDALFFRWSQYAYFHTTGANMTYLNPNIRFAVQTGLDLRKFVRWVGLTQDVLAETIATNYVGQTLISDSMLNRSYTKCFPYLKPNMVFDGFRRGVEFNSHFTCNLAGISYLSTIIPSLNTFVRSFGLGSRYDISTDDTFANGFMEPRDLIKSLRSRV